MDDKLKPNFFGKIIDDEKLKELLNIEGVKIGILPERNDIKMFASAEYKKTKRVGLIVAGLDLGTIEKLCQSNEKYNEIVLYLLSDQICYLFLYKFGPVTPSFDKLMYEDELCDIVGKDKTNEIVNLYGRMRNKSLISYANSSPTLDMVIKLTGERLCDLYGKFPVDFDRVFYKEGYFNPKKIIHDTRKMIDQIVFNECMHINLSHYRCPTESQKIAEKYSKVFYKFYRNFFDMIEKSITNIKPAKQ